MNGPDGPAALMKSMSLLLVPQNVEYVIELSQLLIDFLLSGLYLLNVLFRHYTAIICFPGNLVYVVTD